MQAMLCGQTSMPMAAHCPVCFTAPANEVIPLPPSQSMHIFLRSFSPSRLPDGDASDEREREREREREKDSERVSE